MQHSPTRALCICADDFGLNEGVNRAILVLRDKARVHAVSCMVGGKAWKAGAGELRRRNGEGVDLGLHLDLTESPLQPGSKRRLGPLIVASMLRCLPRKALRREIDAQLDAFEEAIGARPAYVDGHQHVHQLPVVRSALLSALAERYGDSLPWLRATRGAWANTPAARKALIIERLGGRALASLARQRGFRQNAHLLGVYDFRGGEVRYRSLLREWLQLAADGDLLMCHPGDGADASDGLAAARRAEFSVLASDELADWLCRESLSLQAISRYLAVAP